MWVRVCRVVPTLVLVADRPRLINLTFASLSHAARTVRVTKEALNFSRFI